MTITTDLARTQGITPSSLRAVATWNETAARKAKGQNRTRLFAQAQRLRLTAKAMREEAQAA